MRVAYRLAALLAVLITALTLVTTVPASAAGRTRTLWNAFYGARRSGATGEAVSPDGSTLFVTGYTGYNPQTGATGGATIAYNAATGAAVWTQATPGEVPGLVAVSPDGSTVFANGYDTSTGASLTIARDAATGAVLWTQQYTGAGVIAIAVSPDGSTLYVMTEASAVLAYATATGHLLWASPSTTNFAYAGALSPDGSTLFITGHSATVAIDAATGARLWIRHYGPAHPEIFYTSSGAVSRDGSEVYVAGYGSRKNLLGDVVRAYDSATGATRWTKLLDQTATGSDLVQTSLGVSPDGSMVFVSGEGGHRDDNGHSFWVTQARDASTGKLLWSRDHGAPKVDTSPYTLAVNPSGSAVYVTGTVYGGEAGKTVAYSAATGAQLWAAFGEANGLQSPTVVAPDGSACSSAGKPVSAPSARRPSGPERAAVTRTGLACHRCQGAASPGGDPPAASRRAARAGLACLPHGLPSRRRRGY